MALARLNPKSAIRLAAKVPEDARGAIALASLSVLAEHAVEAHVDRFLSIARTGDTPSRQKAWDILAKDRYRVGSPVH